MEAKEEQKPSALEADNAAAVVEGLRSSYRDGCTRSYEWREHQLRQILKLLCDEEDEIVCALHEDTGKPAFETFIQEVLLL